MPDQNLDPVTGLVYVAAQGTSSRHLAEPGGYITLCGRIALYRLRFMPRAKPCNRCQWESSRPNRKGDDT